MTQKPEETIARLLELSEVAQLPQALTYQANMGQSIYEHDDYAHKICDMRGWGHLTGKGGGLGLSFEEAAPIQDARGELMALTPQTITAIRQLLATMKLMGEALEIVNAIARGDKASIEKHGFDFNGGEKCSVFAESKINAAISAYAPFKALAEKAGV